MKKGELLAVIGVLIVLNFWLLYSNSQKDRTIEEIITLEGQNNWQFETIDSTLLYLSHNGLVQTKDSLNLVVFFSDQGCQSCIKDEVSLLNVYNEEYPSSFTVYFLSLKAPTYLSRMFDATFDYQVIDPNVELFDVAFQFVNPVAVLVDSTGLVHRVHKAQVGNKNKSKVFYKQMSEFFHPEHGR